MSRYYSLFARDRRSKGKWQQIGAFSFRIEGARRYYQDLLIASALGIIPEDTREYRLRPTAAPQRSTIPV